MAAELLRTGLTIGGEAPEFDLPASDGRRLRLSDFRGQPVVLHFISYTCPVTRGGVETMRELHRLYGAHVRFLEILVRQAHPGGRHAAYGSESARSADAKAYIEEEHPSWPVLVDDLAGTVQRAYGGLAAAVYLIDRNGQVAFCGTWGPSPALRAAIDDLLARGGSGTPAGKGSDRRPHLAAAIVAGQRGPLNGGHQAIIDLELGFPGAIALMTPRTPRPTPPRTARDTQHARTEEGPHRIGRRPSHHRPDRKPPLATSSAAPRPQKARTSNLMRVRGVDRGQLASGRGAGRPVVGVVSCQRRGRSQSAT